MQTNNNDNRDRNNRDEQNNMNRNQSSERYETESMGNRGNAMDDDWSNSTQLGHESDGPRMQGRDIGDESDPAESYGGREQRNMNSSWEDEGDSERDPDNAKSRTFDSDEETWEEEQRMGGTSSNRGSENNDWNQTDQMQRGPGRSNAEENRDASSSDYYEDRDEERRRNNNGTRNNSGDDF
jgi:hypothetical protein